MKKSILSVVVLAMVIFAGCTTVTRQEIPSTDVQLARASYTILGEVKGEASAQLIFGYPFVTFKTGTETYASIGDGPKASTNPMDQLMAAFGLSTDITGALKSVALYDALKKMPEADFIFAPKYELIAKGGNMFGILTVKITAQGIKLKDGEQN